MAQSWLKEETSSSHSERAGGRTQSQSQPQAQVQAQAQARARAHAQAQVPVQIQVQVHAQTNSDVPSSRTFANMNQAANVPSSMSRGQSTEAQTPTLLAPSSTSSLTTTTPSFSTTDSATQPSSSLHPIAINNFNTIDIPYTESNYSSSNVSPASTSTPATPSAAADTLAASSSPSVSASAPASSASSTKAPSASTSSDARAPTVTSASSQVKAKRVRTSKPKVKTGCTNCKQRRIKCDEARPACTQCVRSNKNCTGYPPPSRSSRPFEEIRIAPKPMPVYDAHASSSAPIAPLQGDYHLLPRRVHQRAVLRAASPGTPSPSPTTYQPSVALQIQPNETFYFDVFRSHTAHELSGFFNNLFWTHYVLQECHSEDAIKCAVIALGALYQTLEQTAALNLRGGHDGGSDARVEAVRSHWQVAIRRYGDACNALVKLNTQDQRSHRTSIMANVLLACFDSFIGDHRQAIHQIQTGLGLLDIFRTQQRQRLLPASEHSLEEELVTIFTRLAIQAKSYDMAFHFPQPFSIRLSSQSQTQSPGHSGTNTPLQEEPISIPENFTSVIEARVACDTLNARIMRYIEELFSMKTDLRGTLPPSWLDYGLSFKNHLDAWAKAFDNLFFTRHNPSVSLQEKAGIAALKMLATNSRILYLMMFSEKESDFDNFLPQFQTIVDLGIEIVGDEERRAAARDCPNPGQCQHRQRETWQPQDFFPAMGFSAPHIKPRFAADLGIVAPLFVVATKCRDPGTRRRAIQLLRSSARREGMWDSEMVANISAWVMNLEESEALAMGVESYPADGVSRPIPRIIPEGKRFTIRSVDFDLRTRVADLHVGTRGLPPGVPDPKFRQTRLNW